MLPSLARNRFRSVALCIGDERKGLVGFRLRKQLSKTTVHHHSGTALAPGQVAHICLRGLVQRHAKAVAVVRSLTKSPEDDHLITRREAERQASVSPVSVVVQLKLTPCLASANAW